MISTSKVNITIALIILIMPIVLNNILKNSKFTTFLMKKSIVESYLISGKIIWIILMICFLHTFKSL